MNATAKLVAVQTILDDHAKPLGPSKADTIAALVALMPAPTVDKSEILRQVCNEIETACRLLDPDGDSAALMILNHAKVAGRAALV